MSLSCPLFVLHMMQYIATRTSGPFGPLVLVSYAFNWVQGFTDSQTGVIIWISNGQTWYWEKVSPNILICLKNSSFESVAMFTHGRLFYYWSFYRTIENTKMKFDTVEKVINSRMDWNHKRTPSLISSWRTLTVHRMDRGCSLMTSSVFGPFWTP